MNKINTEIACISKWFKLTNYPLILKKQTLCYFAIKGLEK